jgi:hypothetical protein
MLKHMITSEKIEPMLGHIQKIEMPEDVIKKGLCQGIEI